MSILSIDAGTTGVTVLVVNERGEITSRGYSEFEQHFPKPGWVEHDPEQIWQAVIRATDQAVTDPKSISAIGITNQRETLVIWNRKDLSSPRRAIVWQDRRTADIVEELKPHNEVIRSKTGTSLDPYFTSTKLVWLQRNEPELWAQVVSGELAIGTVDSYLVARLSGGKSFITDASNASRTQLCNIATAEWDDDLLELFDVPKTSLPTIVNNYGDLAQTDPNVFLGIAAPITGMAGDQQAALFGQAALDAGESKCTFGTGAFLLVNTGGQQLSSKNGLITTIAWKEPTGEITYALEGSVFVAGSAVQWLRDGLGIIDRTSEVEALAASVPDSGGVTFIPALTGLGAPWWNSEVRGNISGITRGTTKAHIARATLEAVAFQVTDLVRAAEDDLGFKIETLKADGGMCSNSLLMQIQANFLNSEVQVAEDLETTAIGAAYLAAIGAGLFAEKSIVRQTGSAKKIFKPSPHEHDLHSDWKRRVTSLL